MRPQFRFESLEIWQEARDLAIRFHRLAEQLDQRKLFRYAEQLRAAGLSLANNIAEGSGSTHKQEFILETAVQPKERKETKEFEGFTQTRTHTCRVNGA